MHIILPEVRNINNHSFHQFVIRVKKRKEFIKHLTQKQIGFGIHYPFPIHLQKAYKFLGYKKGSLPLTEKYAKEIISLPIFPELTMKEVKYIVDCINAYKVI